MEEDDTVKVPYQDRGMGARLTTIEERMELARTLPLLLLMMVLMATMPAVVKATDDPLPSWSDGPVKQAVTDFVNRVTTKGGSDFVPPAERITTFDNDGTLWAEHPMYLQFLFALDRVKAIAPSIPNGRPKQPFASLLKGDMKGAFAGGERGHDADFMATHAGMTTDEFEEIVKRLARDVAARAIQTTL